MTPHQTEKTKQKFIIQSILYNKVQYSVVVQLDIQDNIDIKMSKYYPHK